MGTTPNDNGDTQDDQQTAPATSLPPAAPRIDDGPPPEIPEAGKGPAAFADTATIHVQTNFVEVPFIVKDKKGRQVPGLTWRDVRVYENGLRQQMAVFTVDPFPLSVALVIDQSLTVDNMAKVNSAAMSALAKGRLHLMTRWLSLRTTTGHGCGRTLRRDRVRG